MVQHWFEIRSIPIWLLQRYLEDLERDRLVRMDGWLAGSGWQARLTEIDNYCIGALRVGQVRVELQGEAATVARLQVALEPKLLRAGG